MAAAISAAGIPMTSNPASVMEPRVCHINTASGFRGGERQTELLVRELAARHWRQLLVARAGGPLAKRCQRIDGLEIAEIIPHPTFAAAAARGSSIVHAHEARATYAGWLLQWWSKTPYLLTRRIGHPGGGKWLRARAYRSANCVVAVSSSIARTIEHDYPEINCRIVPDAHADMLASRGTPSNVLEKWNGKTIIGHIGALRHDDKGQGTIIEAARQLQDSQPNLHFVLLGDGKDDHEFRRAAEDLRNLEFVGFVDNVADYLAAFDIFVYPSLREGLGSSLLDAMQFGLPIVATRVGGIPEIVEDQVNGLLIPPSSPRDLIEALRRILEDAELRKSMRRENRNKAAQYGVGRMASSYESIYRSILRGKG